MPGGSIVPETGFVMRDKWGRISLAKLDSYGRVPLVPWYPSQSLISVVAVHGLVASGLCKKPDSTPPDKARKHGLRLVPAA